MPRTKIEFRTNSKESYKSFCKKHPEIKITFIDWKIIIHAFNEGFRDYILETGEKLKMPYGFGHFSINKKRRKKQNQTETGTYSNLAIDWQKTKEKGKRIYNFNFHTEGFFFGWQWFKDPARFRFSDLWYFKPSRVSSRLINHYIKVDDKYQHLYRQWILQK